MTGLKFCALRDSKIVSEGASSNYMFLTIKKIQYLCLYCVRYAYYFICPCATSRAVDAYSRTVVYTLRARMCVHVCVCAALWIP